MHSYNLNNSIKVQSKLNNQDSKEKWGIVEISTIFLKEPSLDQRYIIISLRNQFLQSMVKLTETFKNNNQDQKSQKDFNELQAKDILNIIILSPDFNTELFYENFAKLLSKSVYKDEPCDNLLTLNEIRLIHLDDYENLIAEYIRLFFINTWMNQFQ